MMMFIKTLGAKQKNYYICMEILNKQDPKR